MTREEYDVHEKVAHEYYEWLLTLVNQKKNGKYSRLLKLLHETEFIFHISRDSNRAVDGENLMYRFAYEYGYSYDFICKALDRPCSMLEMMVALCIRCQEYIVVDSVDNQLSGDLFLDMLHSLRLDQFYGVRYNELEATDILKDFLDGYGPLFGPYNGRLRKEELWSQAMRHLNELVFEGSMTL